MLDQLHCIHKAYELWLFVLPVAAMNEMTWQHVLQWEQLHAHECGQPTLLRFLGRPDELRCLRKPALNRFNKWIPLAQMTPGAAGDRQAHRDDALATHACMQIKG